MQPRESRWSLFPPQSPGMGRQDTLTKPSLSHHKQATGPFIPLLLVTPSQKRGGSFVLIFPSLY